MAFCDLACLLMFSSGCLSLALCILAVGPRVCMLGVLEDWQEVIQLGFFFGVSAKGSCHTLDDLMQWRCWLAASRPILPSWKSGRSGIATAWVACGVWRLVLQTSPVIGWWIWCVFGAEATKEADAGPQVFACLCREAERKEAKFVIDVQGS